MCHRPTFIQVKSSNSYSNMVRDLGLLAWSMSITGMWVLGRPTVCVGLGYIRKLYTTIILLSISNSTTIQNQTM